MRRNDIRAKQTQQYRATNKPNKAHIVAPDLLKRNSSIEQQDQKRLADISCNPPAEERPYLVAVFDLCSRRIVGWSMSERMTSILVEDGLKVTAFRRQSTSGLVHHPDQGSHHTGRAYQELMKENGIQARSNSVGAYYGNAPMESFFGKRKTDLVHRAV